MTNEIAESVPAHPGSWSSGRWVTTSKTMLAAMLLVSVGVTLAEVPQEVVPEAYEWISGESLPAGTPLWMGPSPEFHLGMQAAVEKRRRLNNPNRKGAICCAFGAGAVEIGSGVAAALLLPQEEGRDCAVGVLVGGGVVTAGLGVLGLTRFSSSFKGRAEHAYAAVAAMDVSNSTAAYNRELAALRSLRRMSDADKAGRYVGCVVLAATGLSMVGIGLRQMQQPTWGLLSIGGGVLVGSTAFATLGQRTEYERAYADYLRQGGRTR